MNVITNNIINDQLLNFLNDLDREDITNIETGEFQTVVDRYNQTLINKNTFCLMNFLFNMGYDASAKALFQEQYEINGKDPKLDDESEVEFHEFFAELLADEHEKIERGF